MSTKYSSRLIEQSGIRFLGFRLAVKYIKHMQYLMAIPPNQNIPQHIVEFDPGVPSWRKNPQVPGDVLPLGDFEGRRPDRFCSFSG